MPKALARTDYLMDGGAAGWRFEMVEPRGDVCPNCGDDLEFDEVDIGVGVERGNPRCLSCGWYPNVVKRHSSECTKVLHGQSLVGCLKVKWDNGQTQRYDDCCEGVDDGSEAN